MEHLIKLNFLGVCAGFLPVVQVRQVPEDREALAAPENRNDPVGVQEIETSAGTGWARHRWTIMFSSLHFPKQ